MKEIVGMMKFDRDFELALHFNDSTIANLKPLENPDFKDVDFSSTNEGSSKGFFGGGISIKDCLSLFG